MVYNSSRVKSINLKLLYLHSTWPSSSNRSNAWMLFGLSISTMTSCRQMSIKPSYIPFALLYSRHVILQFIILIIGKSCVFPHNYDDVAFTGISCVIYKTCSKMGDGVFTSLWLGLINISLWLQCYFLILDGLYLIVTVL